MHLEDEISHIDDDNLRVAVATCVEDYWEKMKILSASTSGKYHPPEERGPGGMVLHIRRMCNLAIQLDRHLALSMYEKDLLIAGCILHDISNCVIAQIDENGRVTKNDKLFKEHHSLLSAQIAIDYLIKQGVEPTSDMALELHGMIASHMGYWYEGWRKPVTKLELVLSLLDFVDTRTNVHIDV